MAQFCAGACFPPFWGLKPTVSPLGGESCQYLGDASGARPGLAVMRPVEELTAYDAERAVLNTAPTVPEALDNPHLIRGKLAMAADTTTDIEGVASGRVATGPAGRSSAAARVGQMGRGVHTTRLAMLAPAETDAATMVAAATDAANQLRRNQYQRGAFNWSQYSRPNAVRR